MFSYTYEDGVVIDLFLCLCLNNYSNPFEHKKDPYSSMEQRPITHTTSPEYAQHRESLNAEVYVHEKLHKNSNLQDIEKLPRPSYIIAGREVVFRNRQEAPQLAGRDIAVLDSVAPVRLEEQESRYDRTTDYLEQARRVTSPEATIAVTNTPLGLVEAASALVMDKTQREGLKEVAAAMKRRDYADARAAGMVDLVMAAVSIDDEGRDREELDSDGFAVALAALTGDNEAGMILEAKRQALLANEASRVESARAQIQELAKNYEAGGVEPLPLEEMALVHVTTHELEYDEAGAILMRPAAQRREDEFPRSTIHFTLNSRVAAHAEAQDAWRVGDKMIVSNLGRTVAANDGKLPDVLEGVDTYYSLNPGEAIAFPDATVVEAVDVLEDDRLVAVDEVGRNVRYVLRDNDAYTAQQQREIQEMAERVQVPWSADADYRELLQEVALRTALDAQGIRPDVMDLPSVGGHGMRNGRLGERIHATAAQLGLLTGTHFNHPHSAAERDMFAGLRNDYVGVRPYKLVQPQGSPNFVDAGLANRRQQAVSGAYPARPYAYGENPLASATAIPDMMF